MESTIRAEDHEERQRRAMVEVLEAQNKRIRQLELDLQSSKQELYLLRCGHHPSSPVLSSAAFQLLRIDEQASAEPHAHAQHYQPIAAAGGGQCSEPNLGSVASQNRHIQVLRTPERSSGATVSAPMTAASRAAASGGAAPQRPTSSDLQRCQKHQLEREMSDSKKFRTSRYWSPDEHERFLEALQKFGVRGYSNIAAFVGTRTPRQVRTHAQKFRLRMEREAGSMADWDKDGVVSDGGGTSPSNSPSRIAAASQLPTAPLSKETPVCAKVWSTAPGAHADDGSAAARGGLHMFKPSEHLSALDSNETHTADLHVDEPGVNIFIDGMWGGEPDSGESCSDGAGWSQESAATAMFPQALLGGEEWWLED
mmetsp:Transcript_10003/g.26680  ORF Transcript_10003/g.26680 Transcript_10003/m.26680 type:complete len:368 (+) Transcript_10003:136-1239(+)|eukprot:CAMPEP_0185829580 /NCGR_PEP_ID=MMETSP1353-20130828/338_1 /TAXON_ID=1077150 /ORGANISM="Erythrolobus australicus, Strain CCMP3124" /LENGTH=367 /DNA_ID=CAMNT_0028527393 /DNA_START=126 /DNA_END=1229 /DNA_ORIENTATION=-